MQTDEDRQIERLLIHRNLVGWVIDRLKQSAIEAVRTTGNDENGDIRLLQAEDIAWVEQFPEAYLGGF